MGTLQGDLVNAARAEAASRVVAVRSLLDAGLAPAEVAGKLPDGHYVIQPANRPNMTNCPDDPTAAPVEIGGATVYPPDCVLGHESGPAMQLQDGGTGQGGKFMLYAWGDLDPVGLRTVAFTERILWGLVPAVSLLIGAVAWLSVRRSLRTVENIRSAVTEVRATDLSHRVAVPDSGDEITRLAETMNDMLDRLDRALRKQVRLNADVAHELRTPLASMRTQMEVLLAHPARLDWRQMCEKTLVVLTRMQDVVADLLLLSRLDAGVTSREERVHVAELVEDHVGLRASPPGIEVVVEVRARPVVTGNPRHLDRLLRNLVDNAERYAAATVTITLDVDEHLVSLIVDDDGAGIPEADRERVFERFVRLDEHRSRGSGGSGLGLAIAAEIAREHGGSLTATSGATGARFELRIPEAAAAGS